MKDWRLIEFKTNDAFTNMATDESILEARVKNLVPNTLRFYSWKPSAVSVGFFQSLSEEVNSNECKRLGIDIVRRYSGGGAVYHDEDGEVTYSITVSERDLNTTDMVESFHELNNGLIYALKEFGVNARFAPLNDIVIEKRKISGCAQLRRHGIVLQHGTILVNLNPEVMFRVLNIPKQKLIDKNISKAEKRVTSLEDEISKSVSLKQVYDILVPSYSRSMNIDLKPAGLTEFELKKIEQFKTKYSSYEWNYRR